MLGGGHMLPCKTTMCSPARTNGAMAGHSVLLELLLCKFFLPSPLLPTPLGKRSHVALAGLKFLVLLTTVQVSTFSDPSLHALQTVRLLGND